MGSGIYLGTWTHSFKVAATSDKGEEVLVTKIEGTLKYVNRPTRETPRCKNPQVGRQEIRYSGTLVG